MTKIVHSYHPQTLAYVGPTEARESPRRPGSYLIPANATELAPPAEAEGFSRHFADGEWQQWPIVVTPVEPGVEPTLEDVKASQRALIDQARDNAIGQPFAHAEEAFDATPDSYTNITGLVMMASIDPTFASPFITADNKVIELDAEQLIALGRAALEHKSAGVFRARQLKDQINAAATIEEVRAVAW